MTQSPVLAQRGHSTPRREVSPLPAGLSYLDVLPLRPGPFAELNGYPPGCANCGRPHPLTEKGKLTAWAPFCGSHCQRVWSRECMTLRFAVVEAAREPGCDDDA